MRKKVFFGLAGFGAWGKMHAQSIVECPDAELRAIVAPSEVTRSEAGKLYPSVEIHPDVGSMLARGGLDIVSIVTPSHTHLDACRSALEAGCHVLLEKPMALSVKDCRTLVDLASTKNRLLAVGHELRLSSQWGEVRHRIEQGVIGTPRYVLVELSRKPYRLGASGWRYDGTRVGSWVLEEPIHFFDLARWYLSGEGEPATIYAAGNSIDPARPHLHDNFSAIMKYESGAYAVVSQTLAAFEHHQTVKVAGTKGAIWASWSGAMDRTFDPSFSLRVFDGKGIEEVKMTQKSGEVFELREEIAMCVRCIREGTAPAATGNDGLWSTALCLAAEQSIATGKTVNLQQFLEA